MPTGSFDWIKYNSTQSYNPELPNTGNLTYNTQEAQNTILGYGRIPAIFAAGESGSGNFFSIYAITASVLSSITITNATGSANLVGITLDSGISIEGPITSIGVASGSIICYK